MKNQSTDSAIRIKERKRWGFLSLLFLVLIVPNFFYFIWLYQREYRFFLLNSEVYISELLDLSIALLDREIKESIQIAEEVAFSLSSTAPSEQEIFFQRLGNEFQEIFYFKRREGGRFICLASNKPLWVGESFDLLFPLKKQEKWTLGEDGSGRPCLYFTHEIREREELFLFSIPLNSLLNRVKGALPSVEFSFVSKGGTILASTRESWVNFALTPLLQEREVTTNFFPLVGSDKSLNAIPSGKGYEIHSRYLELKPIERLPLQLAFDFPRKRLLDPFFHFSFFLFSSLMLFIGFVVFFLHRIWRRVAYSLDQLTALMKAGALGKFELSYKKEPFGFEWNDLGLLYNRLMERICGLVREMSRDREKKEFYATQISLATEIQSSFLPQQDKKEAAFKADSFYLPAIEVAGDLFDYIRIDSDRVLIFMLDVAGKGLQPCLYSMTFRTLLKGVSLFEENLGILCEKINDLYLADIGESCLFVTAWVGIYHEKSRLMEYLSFGHPPALVKRKDFPMIALSSENLPFGIQPMKGLESQHFQVESQDLLLLYTDGITEAMNIKGELFGLDRLKFILHGADVADPEVIIQNLRVKVEEFSPASERQDDRSILALLFR